MRTGARSTVGAAVTSGAGAVVVGGGGTGVSGAGAAGGGATSTEGTASGPVGACSTTSVVDVAADGLTVSPYASADAPATPTMPMPANAHEVAAARRNPERVESMIADAGSGFFEDSKNSQWRRYDIG